MDEPIRETGPHLAELLRDELQGEGPLYRLLSDALRHAIDLGEVPLGTVLPPERALARELSVSRATVVAAYDRLKADGWLESRQGSGTWVRTPPEGSAGADAVATARLFLSEDGHEQRTGPGEDATPGPDVIDLSVAAVTGTPTVNRVLASLTEAEVAELTDHHGYLPQGLRRLRDLLAANHGELGLPCRADQLVITTGAHQGISLVSRQLLSPGDTVLVESPTFPGALDVFRRFGARAVPVPIDEDGMRTDLLEDLVDRTAPKMLYVAPHFQNPTGTVLPHERRAAIARLSLDRRLPVLEDLAMARLRLDEDLELPPPIASFEPDAPIYSLGSTAKVYWAGLRVGWIRSPIDAAPRTLAVKTVADLGSPLISQLLAVKLIEHSEQITAERRAELRPRRDLLIRLLHEHLPEWRFTVPAGGLSLWITLPRGNAEEFTDLALRHGVSIVPGPALSVDDGNRRAIRLVFAAPAEALEEGVRRLARAWDRYGVAEHRPTGRLLV